ncbi:Crp/Fnr family transcriptional regulator [Terricaulis silvestris]|uniref:Cyclic nucleotide-binding domain protein n=1 Tax=Terricaulis silvestris TaxID=2686094 RepID=A0A6I6MHC0_9CAUL|nr:cyclic nucleotide-binding domain-containing protein [Terricaulis silvestris]QGZ94230.1 Cyclic nucleotide-binding domain protein [Terricaulis silvestris]
MRSAEEFCEGLPVVAFAAGDVLLGEGALTGRLYVLLDGAVEVLKGELQINVVADRGAIFGDMSALLGIPHMATVRADGACRAYVAEDGVAFLQANPELSFVLAKLLAHRLYGVTAYLADLKLQFEDQANHLGMVDDILETLLHEQNNTFTPGSDREPDY